MDTYIAGDLHLFTDDHPETTLKNLGFKNRQKAIDSIIKIEHTFSCMKNIQKINTCSPMGLRPRYFLDSKIIIEKFYLQQKMYRVLGLLNRAKIIVRRYTKTDIIEAIEILQRWLDDYKLNIKKYSGLVYKKC